jgi:hypothetical protein
MFAVAAAVVFFLMAIGVKLGSLGMLYLALMFLCLHLAWTIALPAVWPRRNPPQ